MTPLRAKQIVLALRIPPFSVRDLLDGWAIQLEAEYARMADTVLVSALQDIMKLHDIQHVGIVHDAIMLEGPQSAVEEARLICARHAVVGFQAPAFPMNLNIADA